jgi:hypothetical protein
VIDYPTNTGGKPFETWPAWVPVLFELAVLLGAFGTIAGLFRLGGMPDLYHPALKHEPFLRASDDKYFLIIDTKDRRYDQRSAALILTRTGGSHVALLEA